MAMGGSDPMRHQSQMERFSLPGGDLKEVLNYINVGDLLFMLSLAEGILVTSVQALTTALAIVVDNIGRFSVFFTSRSKWSVGYPGDIETFKTVLVNHH
jgi:hypothetical protein